MTRLELKVENVGSIIADKDGELWTVQVYKDGIGNMGGWTGSDLHIAWNEALANLDIDLYYELTTKKEQDYR